MIDINKCLVVKVSLLLTLLQPYSKHFEAYIRDGSEEKI